MNPIPPVQPCRRLSLLLSIGLLHGWGLAATESKSEFRLYTRPLVIPERGTVSSYVLQTSQGRFSFLPPPNWAVKENTTTKEVIMMDRNLITSIRFKVVEATPETPSEARAARWRQTMLDRHPDGKVTAEFPCYTSKVAGVALDLERVAPNKTKVFSRLACIPLPDGRVEFEMTTTSPDLADMRLAFGNVLTSFRVEPATEK